MLKSASWIKHWFISYILLDYCHPNNQGVVSKSRVKGAGDKPRNFSLSRLNMLQIMGGIYFYWNTVDYFCPGLRNFEFYMFSFLLDSVLLSFWELDCQAMSTQARKTWCLLPGMSGYVYAGKAPWLLRECPVLCQGQSWLRAPSRSSRAIPHLGFCLFLAYSYRSLSTPILPLLLYPWSPLLPECRSAQQVVISTGARACPLPLL